MKSMRPAGFGRRAVASLIDSAILFMVIGLFDLLILILPGSFSRNEILTEVISWIFSLGVHFLFYGYLLSRKGTTPGKAVLSLRVLDDTNGTHLSFMRGGFRCALGYWISFIPLGIGYFMVVFRSDKKALHDLMFGSHVWYIEK